ncbi:MAG: PilZ domain-containing protein [Candidatus Omnitrophica bacterium]|nr:PilZ domain-containing protein [Candidatus Omnitrophota bacterium]
MRSAKERRKHPRLLQKLPIKIAAGDYDFTTATKNVSCVGTYCSISKYIPPFTKVLVKLSLPIRTKSSSKAYAVECKGVIVRTEDDTKSGFNIAIFFNDIKESQRKIISRYINQFLPSKSSA